MNMIFKYGILLIVLIGVIIIYQKTNWRNKYPMSDFCLRNLRILELLLSGTCIISFMIAIGNRENDNMEECILNSIGVDTININSYEKVPERVFVEGLYTRKELDTLENDFKNLAIWINANHESVRDSMNRLEIISVDISNAPSKYSSLDNPEWDFYYYNYLKYIKLYNKHIDDYKKCQKKREDSYFLAIAYEYIFPIAFILSLALSIFITICEYNNKQHTKKDEV